MGRLIRDFPFATLLATAGFFISVALIFSADFFTSYDMNLIAENPVGSMMNYLKDAGAQALGVLTKGILTGISISSALGVAGFMIDLFRKRQVSHTAYGGKIQVLAEARRQF